MNRSTIGGEKNAWIYLGSILADSIALSMSNVACFTSFRQDICRMLRQSIGKLNPLQIMTFRNKEFASMAGFLCMLM